MPISSQEIAAANADQVISECDTFTCARYRQFLSHMPAHVARILDVGCNTGRGGIVLKQALSQIELWGLDCVASRVERLDPAVYAKGVCSFSQNLDIETSSIDAIVAGEFIEHVPPEQIDDTLCEFFRVLRLRGRLLMTTPNPRSFWKWKRKSSVILDPSHLTQHYHECLKFRLRTIGFSRIRIYGSGKASLKIGEHFPLFLYGSYLITADKW